MEYPRQALLRCDGLPLLGILSRGQHQRGSHRPFFALWELNVPRDNGEILHGVIDGGIVFEQLPRKEQPALR